MTFVLCRLNDVDSCETFALQLACKWNKFSLMLDKNPGVITHPTQVGHIYLQAAVFLKRHIIVKENGFQYPACVSHLLLWSQAWTPTTSCIPQVWVLKSVQKCWHQCIVNSDVKLQDRLKEQQKQQRTNVGTDLERRGGGCRIRWM